MHPCFCHICLCLAGPQVAGPLLTTWCLSAAAAPSTICAPRSRPMITQNPCTRDMGMPSARTLLIRWAPRKACSQPACHRGMGAHTFGRQAAACQTAVHPGSIFRTHGCLNQPAEHNTTWESEGGSLSPWLLLRGHSSAWHLRQLGTKAHLPGTDARPASLQVMPALKDKQGEYLLKELLKRWANHKVMVRWLSRFFNYLDRWGYCSRTRLNRCQWATAVEQD